MNTPQAPIAVIDMGTNTFHLLVASCQQGRFQTILEQKQGVRLGKNGISKGELAPEAMGRALACLGTFLSHARELGVPPPAVQAFATSAVRSARNGQDFVAIIQNQLGLKVQILDGVQEAEYIFAGVRASGALENETGEALVMDIGGGSVEFILGDAAGQIRWLQSFELGGQRLVDGYMANDPILDKEAKRLKKDLRAQLKPLKEACIRYKPSVLIGASGTFDTLRQFENPEEAKPHSQNWKELGIAKTNATGLLLRSMNREQRLTHAAISELRADMIVVALILVEEAVKASGVVRLRQSDFALKEGVAHQLLDRQNKPQQ